MHPSSRSRSAAVFHRLNARYTRYCALAFVLSLLTHLAYLQLAPAPEAKPVVLEPPERGPIILCPVLPIEVPPPPPRVDPPPLPTIGDSEVVPVDEDVLEEEPEPTQFLPPVPLAIRTVAAPPDTFFAFDEPPVALREVAPEYPELAKWAGAEGRVTVQVTIDATGRVVSAHVVKSDAIATLDAAAVEAAYRWLFRPAYQRDRPVASRIVLPFVFRLGR